MGIQVGEVSEASGSSDARRSHLPGISKPLLKEHRIKET
jgi:hypothetical protein